MMYRFVLYALEKKVAEVSHLSLCLLLYSILFVINLFWTL